MTEVKVMVASNTPQMNDILKVAAKEGFNLVGCVQIAGTSSCIQLLATLTRYKEN